MPKAKKKKKSNRGTEYELLLERLFQAIHRYDRSPLEALERDILMPTVTHVDGKPIMQQVDVFWSFRHGPITYSAVIEARNYKRKITKGAILQFHAVLQELQQRCVGVMVTTKGFQKGAEGFARQHGIELFLVGIGPAMALRYKLELQAFKTLNGGSTPYSAVYRQEDGRTRSVHLATHMIDASLIFIEDETGVKALSALVADLDFAVQKELYDSHTDHAPCEYRSIRTRTFPPGARIRFPAGIEHELIELSFGYHYTVTPGYRDVDVTLGFDQLILRLGEGKDGYAVDYAGRVIMLRPDKIGMCDFCPTVCLVDDGYDFEADPVEVSTSYDRRTLTVGGPWGGCNTCSSLILANDRDGLLRRAEFLESMRGADLTRGIGVAGMHHSFWLGYTGRFRKAGSAADYRHGDEADAPTA